MSLILSQVARKTGLLNFLITFILFYWFHFVLFSWVHFNMILKELQSKNLELNWLDNPYANKNAINMEWFMQHNSSQYLYYKKDW